jgi:hypothetical protein
MAYGDDWEQDPHSPLEQYHSHSAPSNTAAESAQPAKGPARTCVRAVDRSAALKR